MKLHIALIVVVAFAYSMASQKGKLKSKLKKKNKQLRNGLYYFFDPAFDRFSPPI